MDCRTPGAASPMRLGSASSEARPRQLFQHRPALLPTRPSASTSLASRVARPPQSRPAPVQLRPQSPLPDWMPDPLPWEPLLRLIGWALAPGPKIPLRGPRGSATSSSRGAAVTAAAGRRAGRGLEEGSGGGRRSKGVGEKTSEGTGNLPGRRRLRLLGASGLRTSRGVHSCAFAPARLPRCGSRLNPDSRSPGLCPAQLQRSCDPFCLCRRGSFGESSEGAGKKRDVHFRT